MGFILEKKQPRLTDAVYINIYLNRAGIDFFALIKLVKLSLLFKRLDGDSCNVHQTDGLCSAERSACFKIFIICFLNKLVLKGNVVNYRQKCCMAAMIRPIGINHSYFGDCRISVFGFKIILTELDIVNIHCKAEIFNKFFKLRVG